MSADTLVNTLLKRLPLVLAGSLLATNAWAQNFDLVIKNGRVMDPETGYDTIANVGINHGFITKITTDVIEGTRTIDATGHVVAPGFIDFHSHAQSPYGFKLCPSSKQMEQLVGLSNGGYPPLFG